MFNELNKFKPEPKSELGLNKNEPNSNPVLDASHDILKIGNV